MIKILKKYLRKFKIINVQTMNFGMKHRLFLFFVLGIVLGTIIINFYMNGYHSDIGIYNEYIINGSIEREVGQETFLLYCIKKYALEIMAVLIINMTAFNKLFDILYCFYKGLVMGILISSVTVSYGSGGILLYIFSIFPHYFFYIPMIIFSLYLGIMIKQNMKKEKILLPVIKGVFIELIFVVITSFFEVYVNYPFIKYIFKG